jgi:hypothetical protein
MPQEATFQSSDPNGIRTGVGVRQLSRHWPGRSGFLVYRNEMRVTAWARTMSMHMQADSFNERVPI